MKAAVIDRFGPPEVFDYRDVDTPRPGPGELLIRVKACGINHYDLDLRHGAVFKDLTFPHVMGADVAGVVEAVGDGVKDFAPGERVISAGGYPLNPDEWDTDPIYAAPSFEVKGTHTWGGYAEYMTLPARFALHDDTGLSFEDAAAMPLVLMTALNAVRRQGEVKAGHKVLVQAGASGSGHVCVQVANALGAEVAATVGSADKFDMVREGGASLVINYREEDFVERVLKWTGGRGVDAVIDNVGASVFEGNMRCMRKGGIFVNFGLVGGIKTELNLKRMFFQQHQLRGSFMGTIDDLRDGLAMMKAGKVRAAVDRAYPLSQAADAHAYIFSRKVKGKVVLVP